MVYFSNRNMTYLSDECKEVNSVRERFGTCSLPLIYVPNIDKFEMHIFFAKPRQSYSF